MCEAESSTAAAARKKAISKQTYTPEWKERFLMWSAGDSRAGENNQMI